MLTDDEHCAQSIAYEAGCGSLVRLVIDAAAARPRVCEEDKVPLWRSESARKGKTTYTDRCTICSLFAAANTRTAVELTCACEKQWSIERKRAVLRALSELDHHAKGTWCASGGEQVVASRRKDGEGASRLASREAHIEIAYTGAPYMGPYTELPYTEAPYTGLPHTGICTPVARA